MEIQGKGLLIGIVMAPLKTVDVLRFRFFTKTCFPGDWKHSLHFLKQLWTCFYL